nr:MAG TPA: hypothetical protein [Caudoviricetes sp.]
MQRYNLFFNYQIFWQLFFKIFFLTALIQTKSSTLLNTPLW